MVFFELKKNSVTRWFDAVEIRADYSSEMITLANRRAHLVREGYTL